MSDASSAPNKKSRLTHHLICGGVFLGVLGVYLRTMSPTFSFWDCGEFVACGYTLGIAHPPGAPLFMLVSRLFTVLPLYDDIATRINLLSALASAGCAAMAYLICHRLIGSFIPSDGTLASTAIRYSGAIIGALMMAFGRTVWGNAVEAEVYGATMLIFLSAVWLAQVANDSPSPHGRTRYALMAFYLCSLGVGVHMTVLLVIPVIGLYFVFTRRITSQDWRLTTALFAGALFGIVALSSRPNELTVALPVTLIFLVAFLHVFSLPVVAKELWVTLGILGLGALDLLGAVWNKFTGGENGALTTIPWAWISVVAIVIWGLYQLSRIGGLRPGDERRERAVAIVVYAAVTALMVFLVMFVRGKSAFIGLTALAISGAGYYLRAKVNWIVLVALASVCGMILGFWEFMWAAPLGIILISILEKYRERSLGMALALMGGVVVVFLVLAKGLDFGVTHPGVLCIISLAVAAVAVAFVVRKASPIWKAGAAIIFIAVVGFSVNLTAPARSFGDPLVDQNDPSRSLASFVGYLERKQYGSQSMVSRMFTRRGEWENQFGEHRHMGYWGFFQEQFGLTNMRFVAPFILGAFGLWEVMRRRGSYGGPLVILLLLSSVGLILYMNFADGARIGPRGEDYLEVRDRDYFFTPAFALFGLAIGLGVAALCAALRESLAKVARPALVSVATVAICLSSFSLPAVALAKNFHVNDRAGNYIPYDLASNMLKSCPPGAVLVTIGDNDTFPLWALQLVYKVRRDVAVFNTQLGNMDWYISKMRDQWQAPVGLSDEQILALRHYQAEDGSLRTIAYQIVQRFLDAQAAGGRPVCFAFSMPEPWLTYRADAARAHASRLGLVNTIVEDLPYGAFDLEKTDSLLTKEFVIRALGRAGVAQDENSRGLSGIYGSLLGNVGTLYRERGDTQGEIRSFARAVELFPEVAGYRMELLKALRAEDRHAEAKQVIADAPDSLRRELYMELARQTRADGDTVGMLDALANLYQVAPLDKEAVFAYAAALIQTKRDGELVTVLSRWVENHPSDIDAIALLERARRVTGTAPMPSSGGDK